MILLALAAAACLLAILPAGMFVANLPLFRPGAPPRDDAAPSPRVSILIPARNEADAIGPCVQAALNTQGAEVEVVVLDDDSRDETAAIVAALAHRDPRVRLESAPPLPPDWCGKQHACFVLSGCARNDLLMFIDADVRLSPEAVSAAVNVLQQSKADLVSGFPRQETGSFLEKLLLPLIHFLLLGFLPIWRMRASSHPAYAAGCGQLFLTRRSAYERAGGHAAIRRSLHDGLTLPRAFRRAGLRTDLFDASHLATCRMYKGSAETWRGLSKNATEGMASPAAILPWTVLLIGGQVVPPILLLCLLVRGPAGSNWLWAMTLALSAAGTLASYVTRAVMARRFGHSRLSVLAHPLGITLLIVLQWEALLRKALGRPARWRGRDYPASPAPALAEGAGTP